MSAPPAPPPERVDAARFVAAAGFALAGLVVAAVATAALGFGRDVHALRAAALCAILAGGFLLAWRLVVSVRPFGAPARRAAFALGFVIVMTAVVAGAAAWMFVPARPGGMFLVQAVAKRDVLKAWTEMPLSAGTDDAAALKREFDALAKDYPSLVGRLRPDLDRWAKAAAEAISERFRQTPPGDVAGAAEVRRKGRALVESFPETSWAMYKAEDEWVERATAFRVAELEKLDRGDWDGFDRTAPGRHALADEFPQARSELAATERMWAMMTVGEATTPFRRLPEPNPKQVRETCRELERHLLALKTLDTPPEQFRNERKVLFWYAHDAARKEVEKHAAAGRHDLAYAVAAAHWLEWLPTARLLDPEDENKLSELRDTARERYEKAGDPPDPAPPPRERETAPPPREKP